MPTQSDYNTPGGIQNRNFKDESLVGMSWVRVRRGVFPHRRIAACCGHPVEKDDIVVTFPANTNGTLRGTAVVHVTCLRAYLADVPDPIEHTLARWREVRDRFRQKPAANPPSAATNSR